MIEIEFSALARGCLHRRIPILEQLEQEVLALAKERHQKRIQIHWQFSIDTAQTKFQRYYQTIRADDKTEECRKT